MPNTKPPKKYLVKQEWTHPSLPSKVRFVRGTSHALANYYGVGTMKPPDHPPSPFQGSEVL